MKVLWYFDRVTADRVESREWRYGLAAFEVFPTLAITGFGALLLTPAWHKFGEFSNLEKGRKPKFTHFEKQKKIPITFSDRSKKIHIFGPNLGNCA